MDGNLEKRKVLVAVGLSSDVYADVRIDPAEDRVVFDDESLSINPLDKQIIARALSENAEVQTLTVFPSAGEKALRYAAALGVNAVARIDAPAQDAFTAAAHFAAYLGDNPVSLVLCGEASWDFATGEFPRYLSALTGIGLVENVSGFSFAPNGSLTILRQADDREQELDVKLPVILSCNKSIFPPEEVRIPSMREMMLALRFPIQVIPPSESPEAKKYFSNYGYTPRRPPVRFFREEDYVELADLLLSDLKEKAGDDGRVLLYSGRITADVRGPEAPVPSSAGCQVLQEKTLPAHPDLKTARVVVSGGMGADDETWREIEELVELLGGAVACTRPVYQTGRRPYFEHVGQTGVKISPALYIAAGISGALQHIAGIVRSRKILAINTDPEAEIFKYADYGIVGRANEVLPRLRAVLAAKRQVQ